MEASSTPKRLWARVDPNQSSRRGAMARPSPAQGSTSTWRSSDSGSVNSTKEAKLGRRCVGAGKYPPRATDAGRAMEDHLGTLFTGKVEGRLLGQELGED